MCTLTPAWTASNSQLGERMIIRDISEATCCYRGISKRKFPTVSVPELSHIQAPRDHQQQFSSLLRFSQSCSGFQDPQSEHSTRETMQCPKIFTGLKAWKLLGHLQAAPSHWCATLQLCGVLRAYDHTPCDICTVIGLCTTCQASHGGHRIINKLLNLCTCSGIVE